MKKPTVAELMEEVAALKRRIAELEARPPTQHHYFHGPSVFAPMIQPQQAPQQIGWPPGTITCTSLGVPYGGLC